MQEWRVSVVHNSYQWGDIYFTTTPIGMIAFAIPVMSDGRLLGAFLSGFIAFPEMEKDIQNDILIGLNQICMPYSSRDFKPISVHVVSKHQVRLYADQLMKIMKQYRIIDGILLDEKHEKTVQQLNIAYYIEHLKKNNKDVATMILEKQDEIIYKVKQGDISGAKELLNEFLGYIFFDTGMNFDVIKIRIIELIVVMSRSAIEMGAGSRELLQLSQSYLAKLNETDDYETLCLCVVKILEDLIKNISVIMLDKNRMKVKLMLHHISQHFIGKVTAQDVAQTAGISVSRALHLIKEETGLSFSEHLTKCRIDYGKFLLINTNDSITEIANEAGFYDNSQFTKMFRSLMNMTPIQFRSLYKREPE